MTAGPPAPCDASTGHGPRWLLADHHRELEAACHALLATTYADDPRELAAQYHQFEHSTLAHLTAEEDLILPAYADAAPDEARALYDEHLVIRQLLFRVAVEVELHVVRARTIRRLADALRDHAARENATMYPWARDHLALPARRRLFVRIGRSLRSLAHVRTRPAAA